MCCKIWNVKNASLWCSILSEFNQSTKIELFELSQKRITDFDSTKWKLHNPSEIIACLLKSTRSNDGRTQWRLIPLIEKDDLLGIHRGSKVIDNLTTYKNLIDLSSNLIVSPEIVWVWILLDDLSPHNSLF